MSAVDSPLLPNQVALFRGLTDSELSRLSALLHRKTFAAGSAFISAEQPGEVVYVIAGGTVKVFVDNADGNEVILAILLAGRSWAR